MRSVREDEVIRTVRINEGVLDGEMNRLGC